MKTYNFIMTLFQPVVIAFSEKQLELLSGVEKYPEASTILVSSISFNSLDEQCLEIVERLQDFNYVSVMYDSGFIALNSNLLDEPERIERVAKLAELSSLNKHQYWCSNLADAQLYDLAFNLEQQCNRIAKYNSTPVQVACYYNGQWCIKDSTIGERFTSARFADGDHWIDEVYQSDEQQEDIRNFWSYAKTWLENDRFGDYMFHEEYEWFDVAKPLGLDTVSDPCFLWYGGTIRFVESLYECELVREVKEQSIKEAA